MQTFTGSLMLKHNFLSDTHSLIWLQNSRSEEREVSELKKQNVCVQELLKVAKDDHSQELVKEI
jgi:hypothetical protein